MLTFFCDSVWPVAISRTGSRSAWSDCRARATVSSGKCSPHHGIGAKHGDHHFHRDDKWTIRHNMLSPRIIRKKGCVNLLPMPSTSITTMPCTTPFFCWNPPLAWTITGRSMFTLQRQVPSVLQAKLAARTKPSADKKRLVLLRLSDRGEGNHRVTFCLRNAFIAAGFFFVLSPWD